MLLTITPKTIGAWAFIEKHYPNYSSCQTISILNDIAKIKEDDLSGEAGRLYKVYLDHNRGDKLAALEEITRDEKQSFDRVFDQAVKAYMESLSQS